MCYITQVCTNFSFLCAISHRYDQFFIPMSYITQVCTNFSFLRVMSNGFALTFHFYVLYHIIMINSSFLCVISHRYTLTFHSYVLYHIGMNKFFVPVYYSDHAWRMCDWRELLSIFTSKLHGKDGSRAAWWIVVVLQGVWLQRGGWDHFFGLG